MFQVVFPMEIGKEYVLLRKMMPLGWVIVQSKYDDKTLNIKNNFDIAVVGRVCVLTGKTVIQVDESTPEGENFWHDFAKRYPELNPFQKHYGVVRCVDKIRELYEIDDIPKKLSAESLDKVAKLEEDDEAFFVQYYLGDWHPHEDLKVISHAQIFGKGRVGQKMTDWTFKLA